MVMEMEFHGGGGGRPQGKTNTFTIVKQDFPKIAQCHFEWVVSIFPAVDWPRDQR